MNDSNYSISSDIVQPKMIENVVSSRQTVNPDLYTIETMAARISHDLGNPIMIFNNILEIIKLKNYKLTNHEIRRYVEILHRTSWRLETQIKTLSYFNSQRLHVTKSSLLQIIRKSISNLSVSPSIKIRIPDNDVILEMDVEQMMLVLTVLISSAIQSMNGRGALFIRIEDFDDKALLKITDTSDGIPLEILPELFSAEFLNRKIGPCLGMPTCKRIVENHGWQISVETSPFGTTVSLNLLKK